MNISKGQDRTAFVGERHTWKVAHSSLPRFLASVRGGYNLGGTAGAMKFLKIGPDAVGSPMNFLSHGVIANRREARIAASSSVVVPTLSLLGGIVNVQPTVEIVNMPFRELYGCFVDQLDHKVTPLGHMLERPGNIGIYEEGARFVDGGSLGLERLMQSHPKQIHAALGMVTLKVLGQSGSS